MNDISDVDINCSFKWKYKGEETEFALQLYYEGPPTRYKAGHLVREFFLKQLEKDLIQEQLCNYCPKPAQELIDFKTLLCKDCKLRHAMVGK